MLEKIEIIKQRFDEVSDLIIQPDIISDQKRYVKISKEYKDLKKILDRGQLYKTLVSNIEEAQEIIADGSDPEMVEMAKIELEEAKGQLPKLEEEIKVLLIPKDPEDSKNIVVEVRAGTGGDEASIFAGDLHRMYTKYCESKGWKVEVVDFNEGTSGGYKEIIFEVSGTDVYGTMKFEAGVHRVQRVPQTETQGRVHTAQPQSSYCLKQKSLTLSLICLKLGLNEQLPLDPVDNRSIRLIQRSSFTMNQRA